MKIGQLAKHAGLPTSTIRYYEKEGLLPKAKRTASGYRAYDESDLQRIQMIQFCQGLGFSLQELAPMLVVEDGPDHTKHDKVMQRLQDKLAQTNQVISELTKTRDRMVALIHRIEDLWGRGECMGSEEIAALVSESKVRIPVNRPS